MQVVRGNSGLVVRVTLDAQIAPPQEVDFPEDSTHLSIGGYQDPDLLGVRFPGPLCSIIITNGGLHRVGDEFAGLSSLHTLVLSCNRLVHLRGAVFPEGLKRLHLSSNSLQSVRGATFPSTLQTLFLNCNLISQPEEIVLTCEGLRELSLASNRLESLQGAILPASLRILELDHNYFSVLRAGEFPEGLVRLDLQNNPLVSAGELSRLTNLETLDLSFTKMTSPPKCHPLLNTMALGGCPLATLSPLPPGLRRLNVWDAGLTADTLRKTRLPPCLNRLNISYNPLGSLQGVIFPQRLRSIAFEGCEITSLLGVNFPYRLRYFHTMEADRNQIGSLEGVVFTPEHRMSYSFEHSPFDNCRGAYLGGCFSLCNRACGTFQANRDSYETVLKELLSSLPPPPMELPAWLHRHSYRLGGSAYREVSDGLRQIVFDGYQWRVHLECLTGWP